MPVNITAGPDFKLKIESLKDLEHQLLTEFQLVTQTAADFKKPLSAVDDAIRIDVKYDSGNQKWDVNTVLFNLSGGVDGAIKVYKSGKLYDYTDAYPTVVQLGLDTRDNSKSSTAPFPVDPGAIYVGVELDFCIAAGVSFTSAPTSFGLSVRDNASTSDSFTVAFYRKCAPTDILLDAIGEAFKNLVLPFHSQTVANLGVGDVLRHTAAANLQLGLGAGIGFDGFAIASQWKQDIPGLANPPWLRAGINPTLTPGVNVAYCFSYAGTFEQSLVRDSPASARLHLYRSRDTSHKLSFGAGITANANIAAKIAVQKQILNTPKNAFSDPALQNALATAFNAASGEIGSLAGEVDKKITKLLDPINQDLNVGINAQISKTRQSFLLTNYTIDLTNNEYAAAWSDIINGKFVDALADSHGRVQLAPGSGLEKLYSRTASIRLNFFGQAAAQWSTSAIENSKLVYAGNNMFHLITSDGMRHFSKIEGSFKEIDFYFSVDLALAAAGAAAEPDPDLNIIMKATGNPKFGVRIAKTFGYLTRDLRDIALLKLQQQILDSLQVANRTQVLHLVIPEQAYKNLTYSPAGSRPPDDQADRNNYAAFKSASNITMEVEPARFVFNNIALDYNLWAAWNAASTGDDHPNRKAATNYPAAYNLLNATFPNIDDPGKFRISVTLQAASDFMNLCEDMKLLCGDQITIANWESFADHLTAIAGSDVDLDYIDPTALALAQLCGNGKPTLVVGPAPGLTADSSIGVIVTLPGNAPAALPPVEEETAAAV